MKFRPLLFLGCLSAFILTAATSQADDRRFSSTLNATDSAQAGVTRLSSDQVAVLDALVRHDRALSADLGSDDPRAALFSQRLSADERRNAGLTLLSETELTQLDATVERFIHPVPSATGPETGQTSKTTRLTSVMLRRVPEIHGSVTLMVGAGSGGYSEYGGALDLIYYDPARHFAIEVGYSEIHSKGGYGGYCNRPYPYSYRRPNTLLPY